MRVLIIEDEIEKANNISTALRSYPHDNNEPVLHYAETMSLAAKAIGSAKYDLIILDLMLPYIPNGVTSSGAGLELLRLIRDDSGENHTSVVVGVSAYPEEIENIRAKFEAAGVLILTYASDGSWRHGIERVVIDIRARSSDPISVDFLAICALEEERKGFDFCTKELSRSTIRGLNVSFVESVLDKKIRGVVVRLSRMGLVTATQETAVALSVFVPKVLFMPGICAGFSQNAKLGQILVASPAWEYQAGKWSKDKFEIAPQQIDIEPATRSGVDHLIGTLNIVRTAEALITRPIKRPNQQNEPKISPFASGSAVIADASRLNHIQQQHRKIAGLDMEVFGVYYSAHHAYPKPRHVFALKTVVDMADSRKNDDLHEYGCAISAVAGLLIACELLSDPR